MPVFIFKAMPGSAINLNEAGITKNISDRKYYAVALAATLAAVYFFISDKYYVFTKQSSFRKTGSGVTEILTPSGACDFLKAKNIKGRMFNSIDFGHYIAYRFYPEKRIFIDARTELYKYDFYRLYRRAHNYPAEWEALRAKYGFDIALVRHAFSGTERLLRYLYNSKEWALAYYDRGSALFLRDPSLRLDFSGKKIEKPDEALSIAGFFEKIGEVKIAEDIYIKLLESTPGFLEAGNNLAVIYINTGRFNEALSLINKFLERYPASAELYCNKGALYLRSGNREEGLVFLEKSARLDPYLRRASYMLGLVYLEKGDIVRAMRQFEKYLALDPYSASAHRLLGDIYKQKGFLKKAGVEYNEANELER